MGFGRAVPPVIADVGLRIMRPVIGFTGPYNSWDSATRACSGYESVDVIERYEREAASLSYVEKASMCGEPIDQRSIRVAAAILAAAAVQGNDSSQGMRVLDFGGAVGKHMLEMRRVPGVRIAEWVVVESAGVADRLKRFSTDTISWTHAESPDDLTLNGTFDIVLASSVLQYLPAPMSWLEALCTMTSSLIIDRLPLLDVPTDVVMRQNARYNGRRVTYPAWFFGRRGFLNHLETANMQVVLEWEVPEDRPVILGRRQSNVGLLLRGSAHGGADGTEHRSASSNR